MARKTVAVAATLLLVCLSLALWTPPAPAAATPAAATPNDLRSAPQAATLTDRLRLEVVQSGLYCITAADIAGGLGLAEAEVRGLITGGALALSSQGRAVAVLAAADGSALYFYGQALESPTAAANVYWLAAGTMARMAQTRPTSTGGAPRASFPEMLTFERDLLPMTSLFFDPEADFWLWDFLVAGDAANGTKSFALPTPGALRGGRLEVFLQGLTETEVRREHHVTVALNDTPLGEVRWDDTDARRGSFVLPAGALRDGDNQLTLTALLDTGAAFSLVALDAVRVAYERAATAVGDQLILRESSTGSVTVSGLAGTGAVVLDVDNPFAPQLVSPSATAGDGAWVTFRAAAGHEYLVARTATALAPRALTTVAPGTLKAAGRGADYLVIAHPALAGAAGRVADYRAGQGFATTVVTTTEIRDELAYGIPGPQGIKAFLRWVYANWEPVPRYVLLAGEGSYDYKDIMGKHDSLVPPLIVATPYGLAPSDVALADVVGADGVADFALGRLPALTEAELDGCLAKVVAYEAATGAWQQRALFAADGADPDAGDFPADSHALAGLLPDSLAATELAIGPAPLQTAAEVRAGILDIFRDDPDQGALLFTYVGHGSLTQLAAEGLLTVKDVVGGSGVLPMANSPRLPVFAAFACTSGNYGIPGAESIAEALVTHAPGGAIAALAATALEENDESLILARQFLRRTFGGARDVRLGDTLQRAQAAAEARHAPEAMLETYNLLGDPALRLRW